MLHPKISFFLKYFLDFFTNFNQFSEILVDNVDGDIGGDGDGDGQLLDPKLTETIANIYKGSRQKKPGYFTVL